MNDTLDWALGLKDGFSGPMKDILKIGETFLKRLMAVWSKIKTQLDPVERVSNRVVKKTRNAKGQFDKQLTFFGRLKKRVIELKNGVLSALHIVDKTQEKGKGAEKTSGRIHKFLGTMKKGIVANVEALDELGLSWSNIAKYVPLLGGATITGLLIGLLKVSNDFANVIHSINREMTLTEENTAMIAGNVMRYSGYLQATGQEVADITAAATAFRLLDDTSAKGVETLGQFTEATLEMAKGTGLAVDSVAEFEGHLGKLYGLGFHNLRNYGAAFKYIADRTRISAADLMQFTNGLEDLLAMYPDMTQGQKDAKGSMVMDMQAMAGALSDVGVDANKMTGMFEKLNEEMLKGGGDLTGVFNQLGFTTDDLYEKVRKGDLGEIFAGMLDGMKGLDPKEMVHFMDEWSSAGFSLTLADIQKMKKKTGTEFRSMMEEQRKEFKKGELAKKAAENTMDMLFGPWIALKNELVSFFGGSKLGQGLLSKVNVLSTRLTGIIRKAVHWLAEKGPDMINKGIDAVILAFGWLRDKFDETLSWWTREGKAIWNKDIYPFLMDLRSLLRQIGDFIYGEFIEKIWPKLKPTLKGMAVGVKWLATNFQKLAEQDKRTIAMLTGATIAAIALTGPISAISLALIGGAAKGVAGGLVGALGTTLKTLGGFAVANPVLAGALLALGALALAAKEVNEAWDGWNKSIEDNGVAMAKQMGVQGDNAKLFQSNWESLRKLNEQWNSFEKQRIDNPRSMNQDAWKALKAERENLIRGMAMQLPEGKSREEFIKQQGVSFDTNDSVWSAKQMGSPTQTATGASPVVEPTEITPVVSAPAILQTAKDEVKKEKTKVSLEDSDMVSEQSITNKLLSQMVELLSRLDTSTTRQETRQTSRVGGGPVGAFITGGS